MQQRSVSDEIGYNDDEDEETKRLTAMILVMESDKKSSSSSSPSSAVVSDVGAWAMNVISSVGIIMANKQLMSSNGYAFIFATTLIGFHFVVTAMVGMVSNATGYSTSKHVPIWELLWFSIVANISITGMNLSLMLNFVAFYQISKLSMIQWSV